MTTYLSRKVSLETCGPFLGIPSLLTVILLILRTALEDRALQAELGGYADYARQVRHRLIPGIWQADF